MLRALIVDDDVSIVECIKTLIKWEEIGYGKVYTAMSGYEAYEIALKENIDVLVCDLKMPVMGGLELIRKLREENMRVEIIVLTAYEDFSAARDGIELRVYDYILKPLLMKTLERLSNDLSTIAEKRKGMQLIDGFIKNEFDNEIMKAFRECDTEYIKAIFDAIENLDNTNEGERIFHLSIGKLIRLMCDYLREHDFSEETIKQSKEKILNKIATLNSRRKIMDILFEKINGYIQSIGKGDGYVANQDIVTEIKTMISKNYMNDNFGILDISKHFHYSRDYINWVFKSEEGIPIIKYIINLRLKKAKQLLLETSMSVNDISKSVGYNSTSYFISSFRGAFSLTPTDFRTKNRYLKDITDDDRG